MSHSDTCDDLTCPLCEEEIDISDKNFIPCPCGYRVCMFCWHHIRENLNGLCPACRTRYSSDPHAFSAVAEEEIVKSTKERRAKEKSEKGGLGLTAKGLGLASANTGASAARAIAAAEQKQVIERRNLHHYRVVQRNLVYVIGLPQNLCTEEILKRGEYFGQYGKIGKIVVHRNQAGTGPYSVPTASAYVTFTFKEDASASIQSLEGHRMENHLLRASFGTTKYCNNFIRGASCNNPDCVYLHELGNDEDRFTKAEIQAGHSKLNPVPGQNQQLITGGGGPSGTGKLPQKDPVFPPPVFLRDVPPAKDASNSNSSKDNANANSTVGSSGNSSNLPPGVTRSSSWSQQAVKGLISGNSPRGDSAVAGVGANSSSQSQNSSSARDPQSQSQSQSGEKGNSNFDNSSNNNNNNSSTGKEDNNASSNSGKEGANTGNTNMKNGNNYKADSKSDSNSNTNSNINNKLDRNSDNKNKNGNSDNSNSNSQDSSSSSSSNRNKNEDKNSDSNSHSADGNNNGFISKGSGSLGTVGTSKSGSSTSTSSSTAAQASASFNGLGHCAVFAVPVSSLGENSIWSAILTLSATNTNNSLLINPYKAVNGVTSISDLFDLTLPPVDAVGLPEWPKPPSFYTGDHSNNNSMNMNNSNSNNSNNNNNNNNNNSRANNNSNGGASQSDS